MPGSYRSARVVETSQFQHIQALVKNRDCTHWRTKKAKQKRKLVITPVYINNELNVNPARFVTICKYGLSWYWQTASSSVA